MIGLKEPSSKPKESENQGDVTNDLTSEERDSVGVKFDKKMIIGIIAVIAVVVVIAVMKFSTQSGKSVQEEAVATEEVNVEDSTEGTTSESDYNYTEDETMETEGPANKYVEGTINYSESNKNTAPAQVFSESDYVKDLEGADVKAIYNVDHREYVESYANYQLRRAIIDDGMELYWLDLDYKGKKYRMQIPFFYAKDLDEAGICKVKMEILYLENGGQVISYMQMASEDSE